LTLDKFFADKFENTIDFLVNKNERSYKTIANIFRVDIKRVMNEKKLSLDEFHISDKVIAMLADSVSTGTLSATASKEIFNHLLEGKTEKEQLVIFKKSEEDLSQVSDDSEIELIVRKILADNPGEVERYKIGEKKLAGFFVGKIMQESKGKANPKIVNELLIKNLDL
ncbi:MAG: Asp-tRNA(Asn)/Glu-tRNA(Gln) amidotransferase GatCAB subunit B, partial [Ignavibacteria bacterium]|nr:Asp-tRNA(Asn)/Glu-tRNA(Gln) amidotransferase GatCAB subunit B [Ignavibacteria bacterium]